MKRYLSIFSLMALLLLGSSQVQAQCPMCKAAVVSSTEDGAKGVSTAKGLNAGILLLFVLPYACLGTLAFVSIHYVRKHRRAQAEYSQLTVEDVIGQHRPGEAGSRG
jgi:hypothetical protein